MSSQNNSFSWRGQPSEIGKTLIKTSGSTAPAKAHPMRNGTSSINGAEKLKTKPGVGRSATV